MMSAGKMWGCSQSPCRHLWLSKALPLPPDCCPSGWLLYRGKCLFISSEKKTWEDSRDECEKKYSQLLVTKSWSRWTVPVGCIQVWGPQVGQDCSGGLSLAKHHRVQG